MNTDNTDVIPRPQGRLLEVVNTVRDDVRTDIAEKKVIREDDKFKPFEPRAAGATRDPYESESWNKYLKDLFRIYIEKVQTMGIDECDKLKSKAEYMIERERFGKNMEEICKQMASYLFPGLKDHWRDEFRWDAPLTPLKLKNYEDVKDGKEIPLLEVTQTVQEDLILSFNTTAFEELGKQKKLTANVILTVAFHAVHRWWHRHRNTGIPIALPPSETCRDDELDIVYGMMKENLEKTGIRPLIRKRILRRMNFDYPSTPWSKPVTY